MNSKPLTHTNTFQSELQALKNRHRYRDFKSMVSIDAAHARLTGQDATDVLVFCSNDYLNLAHDEHIAQAAQQAIRDHGVGASASRYITGNHPLYDALEQATAQSRSKQACMIFPSGYAANIGCIPVLAREGDVIFSDAMNHASIIDGCRLSHAETRVYPHRDYDNLATMLQSMPGDRTIWIVTESLFSMQGTEADLPRLVALKENYNARLIVDDAHAGGAIGNGGGGLPVETNTTHDTDAIIGTYSKAYGGLGGFLCAEQEMIDWVRNHTRSGMFSTALPPAILAANLAAMTIVRENANMLQNQLQTATTATREMIAKLGLATGPGNRYIIPLLAGDDSDALQAADYLLERGILITAIRPPTVPEGQACLRISLSVAHGDAEIQALAAALPSCPGLLRT